MQGESDRIKIGDSWTSWTYLKKIQMLHLRRQLGLTYRMNSVINRITLCGHFIVFIQLWAWLSLAVYCVGCSDLCDCGVKWLGCCLATWRLSQSFSTLKMERSFNSSSSFIKLPIFKIYTVRSEFSDEIALEKTLKLLVVGLAGCCDHSSALHCGTQQTRWTGPMDNGDFSWIRTTSVDLAFVCKSHATFWPNQYFNQTVADCFQDQTSGKQGQISVKTILRQVWVHLWVNWVCGRFKLNRKHSDLNRGLSENSTGHSSQFILWGHMGSKWLCDYDPDIRVFNLSQTLML